MVHHRGTGRLSEVVGGTMHEVGMEQQQVAGIQQHRDGAVDVVVGDFDVAQLCTRPPVGFDVVERFPVRTG